MGRTESQLLDALLIAIPKMDLIPDDIASSRRRLRAAIEERDAIPRECVLCHGQATVVAVTEASELMGGMRWMDLCASCEAAMARLRASWDDEAAWRRWRYLVTEGFMEPAE